MSVELLKRTSLFRDLDEAQLTQILKRCKRRTYEANEVVVTEGEEGDEMYIVRAGKVEVSKAIRLKIPSRGDVNFEKQLVTLGEGDYFGEVALLASDTRSATVTARTTLDVWVLKSDPMQRLMSEDAELGYKLLSVMSKVLCARLHVANEDIRKLMTAFAIAINR